MNGTVSQTKHIIPGVFIRVSKNVNLKTLSNPVSSTATLPAPQAIPAARPKKALQFIGDENSLDLYFSEIKHLEKLTADDERILSNRIQAGDKAALNKLVEANLKFVVAVCKNYRNQGMPFVDLISEGNLGLIKAAKRFDCNTGCRFITYAVWWIRQGILIALAEQSRFLNVSPNRVNSIRQVGKATRKLGQELGREPSIEEVADHLGFTDLLVTECIELTAQPKSLSGSGVGEGYGFEETLEDRNGESSDRIATEYLLQKNTAKVLDQMEDRKAEVLRMVYGIGCGIPFTLLEIADKLDLSRERVRQIKTESLSLLRHPAKQKLLGI